MKKHYGNYLGIVINNNDPEFRGRVQVFVPHIMPALYKNWNEDGGDIEIKCVGDNVPQGLSTEVIERLTKILPWAEAASPIVGTSSPGGLISAVAGAISQVGSAAAGAITSFFDQSPTTIPAGSLPPGAACIIPTEGSHVDTANLLPGFVQRLNGFYQEATSLGYKIVCSSAYRSPEKQRQLYAKIGSPGCARPGSSSHEYGYAVDLKTTGNGVSITKISIKSDRTSNRDTPEYRALLKKYGLHQPLHPELYKTSAPEKWHIEAIESPAAGNSLRFSLDNKKKIVALLSSEAPSTELPNSSQLPPAPNPLVDSSPTGTETSGALSPTTGLTPSSPASASSEPAISGGGPGIQGTVSGGGTVSSNTEASEGTKKLATDRTARFEHELKDKTLLDRMEYILTREGGASANLIMETAVNRSFFGNRTLKFTFNQTSYYGGSKKGVTKPHTNITLNAIKNVIYNGANATNLATDQAYNDKSLFAKKYITSGVTGDWFDLTNGQKITDPARIQKLSNTPGNGMQEFIYRKDGFGGDGSSKEGQAAKAYAEKYNIQPSSPSAFASNIPLPPEIGTSELTGEQLNTSESPQTVMSTDPHGATIVKNTNDSAKGLFAFPGPGAMVWIFFREGNPMFPVYFAASYSSSEWKSAYNGASMNPEGTNNGSTGTQVANSMRFNPNSAGGLEITHVKDVSDPTGSKNKSNVMIYSEDGSNMVFSKGYHQIYTRHDRRDQVDANLRSIVGGAREEWVEADSSTNIRGNVFIKVGKIDKESLEAVKQLSDFSKQMNETLMQNSGEENPTASADATSTETPASSAAPASATNEQSPTTSSTTTASDGTTPTTSSTTTASDGTISTASSSTTVSQDGTVTQTQTFTQSKNTPPTSTTVYITPPDPAEAAKVQKQRELNRQMRADLSAMPPEQARAMRLEWSMNGKPDKYKA